MIPDVTIPVERFHRVLVDEIQKQHPTYLDTSFTVAEIYQILVPYRSHRDALGVEMNGDYEDALLRLLAGAGDLVVLESDDAKTRILKELQSKNPNTGLFREFAGAGVHLNPHGLPEALRDPNGAAPVASPPEPDSQGVVTGEISPAAEEEAGVEATYFDFETSSLEDLEDAETVTVEPTSATPAEEPTHPQGVVNGAAKTEGAEDRTISLVSATETPTKEPGAGFWKPGEHPVSTTQMTDSGSTATNVRASVGDCLWCEQTLPNRADVNFCPHCGVNTSLKPCSGCRSEMEASWKFCISCGTKA